MKFYQVDAFTDKPYKGNPAAICFPMRDYSDRELIEIAMEMNLSETAFLWSIDNTTYKLRWFTPEMEVDLCGHATLAAAHVLWGESIVKQGEKIVFETLSGYLEAYQSDGWIELDFPKGELEVSEGDKNLLSAFNNPLAIVSDKIAYVVELSSEEEVQTYQPDFELLKRAEREEIIITSKSNNPSYDFVSRFFGPAIVLMKTLQRVLHIVIWHPIGRKS